jgi:hypothetical protein
MLSAESRLSPTGRNTLRVCLNKNLDDVHIAVEGNSAKEAIYNLLSSKALIKSRNRNSKV